uniref:SH2 domain-containing protein n=1 Tax=Loa loa TaxID=7209 RepID=A0A1I7VH65_LOALO
MSMLQQILDQMFVDPEILDALDEEQKQILFIKMREEQVKRWKAFEEQCKQEGEPQSSKSKDNSRRVRWLKGEDGEVWVWVMGEHKDDLTIEQITEKRALEEARQLAEKEMLESMRLTELNDGKEPVVEPHEDENTLKEQLSRIKPWNITYAHNKIQCTVHKIQLQESVYDDADSLFGSSSNGNVNWPSHIASTPEPPRKGILKKPTENLPSNNNNNKGDKLSNNTDTEQLMTEKISGTDLLTDSEQQITEKVSGTNLLIDTSKSNGSNEWSQVLPSTSTPNTGFGETFVSNSSRMNPSSGSEAVIAPYGARTDYLPLSSQPSESDIRRGLGKGNLLSDYSSPYGMKTLDTAINATKPDWMSGNSFNENFLTIPRARLWNINTQITPPQKTNSGHDVEVKFRPDLSTRHDLSDIDEEITKRQSEIFEKIKEKHQQFDLEAEQEAQRVEQAWAEQEKRAREAEAQIRQIAQRAREQHRQQSLRTSNSIVPVLKDTKNTSPLKGALKSLPRPPKPKSREAIINWFKTEELLRGTGLDPVTRRPAVWFHGIIPRIKADRLLHKKPAGSYIVRVSERIWGYTLSYSAGDGNVKHFLIEKIPQGYQFLGVNQVVHRHLHELIAFHEISPITIKGNEMLRWAIGQVDTDSPDYAELIVE